MVAKMIVWLPWQRHSWQRLRIAGAFSHHSLAEIVVLPSACLYKEELGPAYQSLTSKKLCCVSIQNMTHLNVGYFCDERLNVPGLVT